MYIQCFVCIYVCAPHAYTAQGGQQKVLNLLELELQMVMSCHVGARN